MLGTIRTIPLAFNPFMRLWWCELCCSRSALSRVGELTRILRGDIWAISGAPPLLPPIASPPPLLMELVVALLLLFGDSLIDVVVAVGAVTDSDGGKCGCGRRTVGVIGRCVKPIGGE